MKTWMKLNPLTRILRPEPEDDGMVGDWDDMLDDAPIEAEVVEPEPEPEPEPDPTPDVDDDATPPSEEAPVEEPSKPEKETPAEQPNADDDPKPEVEPPESPEPEPTPEPQEPAEEPAPDPEAQKAAYLEKMTSAYAISKEEADDLLADPEVALPKFAANMHMRIMTDVARVMQQGVGAILQQQIAANPQMIQMAMTQATTQQSAVDKFYGDFPELNTQTGKTAVANVARMVATEFPDLTPEQQSQKIGQVAMAMLGLQRKPKEEAPAPTPEVEPFTPARGTGGATNPPASEWEEML